MNAKWRRGSTALQVFPGATDKLLVVYDDLDLPVGKIRLRPNGSAGGQNGMRSLIERLGTMAFARLRVGDRPPTRSAIGSELCVATLRCRTVAYHPICTAQGCRSHRNFYPRRLGNRYESL
jgi:hypothetical protein